MGAYIVTFELETAGDDHSDKVSAAVEALVDWQIHQCANGIQASGIELTTCAAMCVERTDAEEGDEGDEGEEDDEDDESEDEGASETET